MRCLICYKISSLSEASYWLLANGTHMYMDLPACVDACAELHNDPVNVCMYMESWASRKLYTVKPSYNE